MLGFRLPFGIGASGTLLTCSIGEHLGAEGLHIKTSRSKRPPRLSVSDVRTLERWAFETMQTQAGLALVHDRLSALDRSAHFAPLARRHFQDLLARLAIKTTKPITLPLNDQPFWHRAHNPFIDFNRDVALPATADIVIIGAGLTGASAAYHLKDTGLKVVVLEKSFPAAEASGRNGGNFELFPENSVGIYRGLAPGRLEYMQRCYPNMPFEVLRGVSERQASLVLGLALRNRDLLKKTIRDENIACDFSPRGWLHIATDDNEEQALCDEVLLAAEQGQRIEIWSRQKIRTEFGIDTSYLGRFIPGDGTYHPLKFVCGELSAAIKAGVLLFTGARVERLQSNQDLHQVVTNRGTIATRRVIFATNAFTRDVLPELAKIQPYQSQIQVTEHTPDRARGRIVTSDHGPVFFNQPRDGAKPPYAPLLMGGGDDRPIKNPNSRRRSPQVHRRLLEIRDSFYPELAGQPPSAEWIGPMAFTPDGLPCIGFLRPGLIVAAGYNGYGGTYATAAGFAAARMATGGEAPDWVPADVFSPVRLTRREPLFMSDKGGVWRIAASLCRQLLAVNERISDALTLQGVAPLSSSRPQAVVSGPSGASQPTTGLDPRLLRDTPSFKSFSLPELAELLTFMRQWQLPANSVIFTEGSRGGTCFIILKGEVDVSIESSGSQQLLATLDAGKLFGQVTVIEDVPRTATCTTRSDSVLLELDREGCSVILGSSSKLAIKFLAALNEALIDALQKSDLRLMRLERQYLNGTKALA